MNRRYYDAETKFCRVQAAWPLRCAADQTRHRGATRDLSLMQDLRKNARRKTPSALLLCAAIALGKPNVCVVGFVHQGVRSAHDAATFLGCNNSGRASSLVRSTEARHKTEKTTRHGGSISSCTSPTEINSENARCESGCVYI